MKTYDLTSTLIEAMDTPWVYINDNMTEEEKQIAYDDYCEVHDTPFIGLSDNGFTLFPCKVINLEDYR